MQADFLCPPLPPSAPALRGSVPWEGPQGPTWAVCMCTRAHTFVLGQRSKAEVWDANATSRLCPGFSRRLCLASRGGVGPWASAPGRWVARQEVGPFAGRRHCGQLCRVGASGLALCSIRARSQTAPLFSCWDCWEAGRLDWGVWAGGRDTRCQGLMGPVSVSLNVRPRTKVAWEQSQAAWGWQVVAWLWGPGAVPGQQRLPVYTCIPTALWGGFGSL